MTHFYQVLKKRIARFLTKYRWNIIGSAWMFSIALGAWGYRLQYPGSESFHSVADIIYRSIQLFALESGSLESPNNWQLQVARFLSPSLTVLTGLHALASVYYSQFHQLRAWFVRDHLIICGLGDTGLAIARSHRREFLSVVVIEKSEDNELIKECRKTGAIIIHGDASDQVTLKHAKLKRASKLVVVCGADDANYSVVETAHKMSALRRKTNLICLVRVWDKHFCELLNRFARERIQGKFFELEFFNLYEKGARSMLQEHAAFTLRLPCEDKDPHLLIVGFGRMGESLALHAVRMWRVLRQQRPDLLSISVIDVRASEIVELLRVRNPGIEKVCRFLPYDIDVRSAEFEKANFLRPTSRISAAHIFKRSMAVPSVTEVYVCLDDDNLSLMTAMSLQHRVREEGVELVFRKMYEDGISKLLSGQVGSAAPSDNAVSFGLMDKAIGPGVLFLDEEMLMARAIHAMYIHKCRNDGHAPDSKPGMRPWDELSEDFKYSNVDQARDIPIKLASIGCEVVENNDFLRPLFEFDENANEIEKLAKAEHQRWVHERKYLGWQYAAVRNDAKKEHPDMIDYDLLSEEVKEYDRETIRNIPLVLSLVGKEIRRM